MAEEGTRRSIRRAVAALLMPLSILVVQFSIHLRKTAGLVDSAAVNAAETAGYGIIASSVLYLLGSVCFGLYPSSGQEEEE